MSLRASYKLLSSGHSLKSNLRPIFVSPLRNMAFVPQLAAPFSVAAPHASLRLGARRPSTSSYSSFLGNRLQSPTLPLLIAHHAPSNRRSFSVSPSANLLDPSGYTERAFQTLVKMEQLTKSSSRTTAEAEQLMGALLDDDFVKRVIEKVGSFPRIREATENFIARQPRITGNMSGVPTVAMGRSLQEALEQARKFQNEFQDSYVSIESLLLGCWKSGRLSRGLFDGPSIPSFDAVLEAVKEIRGSKKVTSQSAEDTYEALEKYGRDLTEAARNGTRCCSASPAWEKRPLRKASPSVWYPAIYPNHSREGS